MKVKNKKLIKDDIIALMDEDYGYEVIATYDTIEALEIQTKEIDWQDFLDDKRDSLELDDELTEAEIDEVISKTEFDLDEVLDFKHQTYKWISMWKVEE